MPGHNDPSLPNARHMSSLRLYRAAVALADTAPTTETPNIDFTFEPNALDNRMVAVVRRTAGTGLCKLSFYVQVRDGGPLDAVWMLDRTTDWLAVDTLHKFGDLYGGKYLVQVSAIASGGTFSVYLGASGQLSSQV